MTKKHIYQIIIAIIAIGAFGSMGWVGYQLIQKVSEGASHIHSQIKQPEPAPVNSPVLIPIEPIISDSLGNNEPLSEVISASTDIHIQAGDFSYDNGTFLIRLHIQNNGRAAISSLSLKLNLYLNGNTKQTNLSLLKSISLDSILPIGSDTIINIPIAKVWDNPNIAKAKKQGISAQIIMVTGDNGVDYPQNSNSFLLQQVASTSPSQIEPDTTDTEDSQTTKPNDTDEAIPSSSKTKLNPNNDKDLDKLTGEPRILSFELREN
ncbi:MAG: hypothetical protein ACFNXU_04180 [Kingella sp. (in: b-proteobacteria)]